MLNAFLKNKNLQLYSKKQIEKSHPNYSLQNHKKIFTFYQAYIKNIQLNRSSIKRLGRFNLKLKQFFVDVLVLK